MNKQVIIMELKFNNTRVFVLFSETVKQTITMITVDIFRLFIILGNLSFVIAVVSIFS